MKIPNKGFLLTLILSLIMLEVFYGKLLNHCNSVYMGDSLDAIQSYYTAIYHINFDKSYFHTVGMNYPYGENVFFTGGYVPLAFGIKLISKVVNISGYTLGIINLVMLFSIVACALSLYLILREFSLPAVYSAVVAVCIAFLSPQIRRLGGTLSYEFFIPLFIYLLIKFRQNPSYKKSLLIGLLVFFAIVSHFYFFIFFCFIAIFYWGIPFLSREENFSNIWFDIKHFFLQLILPFIALNIIMSLTNDVNDRTHYPWGLFTYLSSWSGVFFPFGKPYDWIARLIYNPHTSPDWESINYVGVVGVLSFFALVIIFLWKLFTGKFKQLFLVTDIKLLNIFFWASFVAMLYSFGYPLKWNQDFFIHHIGPLKELRALGRCAWLFFYMMNIVAFYNLYRWLNDKNKGLKYGILIISCSILFADTCIYLNHHQDWLDTTINELADKQNNLPGDQWIKNTDLTQYQAIIPLPYFHVGSENIWITSPSDILKYVYVVSLKTGMSTTAVWLSRTSISQTCKNIALVLEPYRKLEILSDLPNKKPFLVMAKPNELNEQEKHLLGQCKFLLQTPNYSVYSLDYSKLDHYTDSLYIKTKEEFTMRKTYKIGNFYSTDSVKNFIHTDYEDKPNDIHYVGKGAYTGNLVDYNVLYEGSIPNCKDSNYIFSYWMYDFRVDLYPRSIVEIAFIDSTGKAYNAYWSAPHYMLKAFDGQWALMEESVKIKHATDKIKITLWNPDVGKDKQIHLDEFWLRPATTDIYEQTAEYISKNNRYYRL